MNLEDYPETAKAMRSKFYTFDTIPPKKDGFIEVLNKVRADLDLQPIDLNELVIATLGRVEDRLNEKAQVRTEEGPTFSH
jgi:hypothetical protein